MPGAMWLDLIALGVLAYFVVLGTTRGTLASVLRIGSLLCAYGAAIVLAPKLGETVASQLQVPRLLGVGIAGAGVWISAYLGALRHVKNWYFCGLRHSKDYVEIRYNFPASIAISLCI